MKFGFEKNNFFYKIWAESNEFRLHKNNVVGYSVEIFTYDLLDLHNIQFVHQLQNLYFALIGEELTIKESAAV